jgi:hypothetical protein
MGVMKCEKKCYLTKKLAKRSGRRHRGTKIKITYAYHCEDCSAWHLTTQQRWKRRRWKEREGNGSSNE